jgi:glycolate oxidase FAD binding subunit
MSTAGQPSWTIDGFAPLYCANAYSIADLKDLVRQTAAMNRALYPIGGRTMLDLGLPPTRPGIAVALRHLNQVIDYPARDMTITVQAGITLARLQELLAAENQRLPIDVPKAKRATLGGALATNSSGPRRYGFGTLRDYVLGISVINDEGQETKAGSRVVKNVAGYDMCKLYIGSLGSLGIISQATLKLKPRPEEQTVLAQGCTMEGLRPLLDLLHRSRTRPVCLDVLNQAAAQFAGDTAGRRLPAAAWVAILGFEDNRVAVEWQVRQVTQELAAAGYQGPEIYPGTASEPLWRALVDLPAHSQACFAFKANLLPSATAEFCRLAADWPEPVLLQAHAGNGIVHGQTDGSLPLDVVRERLLALQEAAVTARGNLIVTRCPPQWKTVLPIWGRPRGDGWLMRAIKEKMDPRRIFNPGRFVDGL